MQHKDQPTASNVLSTSMLLLPVLGAMPVQLAASLPRQQIPVTTALHSRSMAMLQELDV